MPLRRTPKRSSSVRSRSNAPTGNICSRFPWLCALNLTSINVNWLNCGTGEGYVLIRGQNFDANSSVLGSVSNCVGAFPVRLSIVTDGNGSFATWVQSGCIDHGVDNRRQRQQRAGISGDAVLGIENKG